MKLTSGDKAGIYITAIIHLVVIIILLVFKIQSVGSVEFYVLDYTEQKPPEIKKKPDIPKPTVPKKPDFDKVVAAASNMRDEPSKSIPVQASGLKDDRNTDANKLYSDHERILKELKEGQKQEKVRDEDHVETPGEDKKDTGDKPPKAYSGPSVLAWDLEGRTARRLPIPAYRCYGAGDVTVIITVNAIGQVTKAEVDAASSSSDGCLRQHSLAAARSSLFSRDDSRPTQMGTIVYRFIAQ